MIVVQLELVSRHDHLVELAEGRHLVLQGSQGLRHRRVELLPHILVQLKLRVLKVSVAESHLRAGVAEVSARQAQRTRAVQLTLYRAPHLSKLYFFRRGGQWRGGGVGELSVIERGRGWLELGLEGGGGGRARVTSRKVLLEVF